MSPQLPLELSTSFKYSLRDTAWMVLLQGLNYLVPLMVWPYLMVVLGADGFGKISFSLQLLQFMMLMIDFGFNLSATKQIATAGNQEEINRIATDTLCAKLLLFACCTIVVLVAMLLPRYAPYRMAVAVMFPMLLGNVFSFQWLFQGLGKVRQMSIVTSVCRLLLLPLTFGLVKSSQDVLFAGLILSSTYVLSGIVMSVWVIKSHLFKLVNTSMSQIRSAIRISIPLFLSTAISSIYGVLFVVILGYFVSPSEVGCYSAVEKIMRVSCYLFLIPTLQVFYPKVSKLSQEDTMAAKRLVRIILVVLIAIMAGIGCALFFGGNFAISLLGKDYTNSEALFHILAIAPIFIATSGICGQLGLVAMGGEKQQKQFRNVYIVGASVALLSIAALSSILTASWAAACLLWTEVLVGIGMYVYYKRL